MYTMVNGRPTLTIDQLLINQQSEIIQVEEEVRETEEVIEQVIDKAKLNGGNIDLSNLSQRDRLLSKIKNLELLQQILTEEQESKKQSSKKKFINFNI